MLKERLGSMFELAAEVRESWKVKFQVNVMTKLLYWIDPNPWMVSHTLSPAFSFNLSSKVNINIQLLSFGLCTKAGAEGGEVQNVQASSTSKTLELAVYIDLPCSYKFYVVSHIVASYLAKLRGLSQKKMTTVSVIVTLSLKPPLLSVTFLVPFS